MGASSVPFGGNPKEDSLPRCSTTPEVMIYGNGACGGGQAQRVTAEAAEACPRPKVTATSYEALVFPPQPMPCTEVTTTQARVFKSWVGHAGDIGGVSIYRGSNLGLLAQEAACLSTIFTKVLTTIRCSTVQNLSQPARLVHVPDERM